MCFHVPSPLALASLPTHGDIYIYIYIYTTNDKQHFTGYLLKSGFAGYLLKLYLSSSVPCHILPDIFQNGRNLPTFSQISSNLARRVAGYLPKKTELSYLLIFCRMGSSGYIYIYIYIYICVLRMLGWRDYRLRSPKAAIHDVQFAIDVCMYVCMFVCLFVCLFVCMYVCMYVIHTHTDKHCIPTSYYIRSEARPAIGNIVFVNSKLHDAMCAY